MRKIAAHTRALLIMQWGCSHSLHRMWNATDPQRCVHTSEHHYHIIVVVRDEEERSPVELMRDISSMSRSECGITATILTRRQALRRIRDQHHAFMAVYRLGFCLHNKDKKTFPGAGHARDKRKRPIPAKPTVIVQRY
ncbi:MAG: hypothetical protein JST39_13785 [Bacteroidetes bacterium]|nr:hypothetical protein [Bacteroidota bacterium]